MTCEACGKVDDLSVLSDTLCRSCFDSAAKGVHNHEEFVDEMVTEFVGGTSFFYQHRVQARYVYVHMPELPVSVLN